jgi:hypothetical protein
MNSLSNGGNLSRFDLASSLQEKVLQVKGVLVVDQMKTANADTAIDGFVSSGAAVSDAGAGTLHNHVPTSLAVHDFVDGNLGLNDADGNPISPTGTEFVHGRQHKLYLGGVIDDNNEMGYSVDTSVTSSSNNLITSEAVRSHVEQKIAELVDSAPDNLDTLKEIAASLNDDSDLFGTLTSQINTNANALTSYKSVVGESLDSAGLLKDVNDALLSEISSRDTSIATRSAAVDTRFDDIDDDLAARASALVSRTSAVDSALGTLTDADAALDTKIDQEISDRETAISTLTDSLASEVTARETAVESEASARSSKDTELQTAIEQEATDRAAAVSSEASTRSAKDTELETAIEQEVTDRSAAVAAEASTRSTKDSELEASIQQEVTDRQDAIAALQASTDDSVVDERATSDDKYHAKLSNTADDSTFTSASVDATPTSGNANLVTSAGVFDAIETAKASILNGAPGALDTLKEIADALGNDADLAATLTNSIASVASARYTKLEIDAQRESIASATATRSSTVDTALAARYTKTQVDTYRQTIASETSDRTAAVDTALADRYTKAEVDTRSATVDTALADRYTKSQVYTKAEIDEMLLNILNVNSITLANGVVIESGDPITTPPVATLDTVIPFSVTQAPIGYPITATLAHAAGEVYTFETVLTVSSLYLTSPKKSHIWHLGHGKGSSTVTDGLHFMFLMFESTLDAETGTMSFTVKYSKADESVGSSTFATSLVPSDFISVGGSFGVPFTSVYTVGQSVAITVDGQTNFIDITAAHLTNEADVPFYVGTSPNQSGGHIYRYGSINGAITGSGGTLV